MADDEPKKPRLHLAVENSQADLDKAEAQQSIVWPLRELAANVMRVARGAGKSYLIAGQCVDVIEAFQNYRKRCGVWPSSYEISDALKIQNPRLSDFSKPYDEREGAIDDMIEGALRLAAARLVSQMLQERAGERELLDGVQAFQREREERRAKWQAELKAQRGATKPAKRANPRNRIFVCEASPSGQFGHTA